MKPFVIGVLIFISVAGYWNFRVYQKTQFLKEFCQPFITACQQKSGCTIAPNGWKANFHEGYYKESMEYIGHHDSFTLRWHIATDVYLIATAGKSKELNIIREDN